MANYQKYLKYKKKYTDLKNLKNQLHHQSGGLNLDTNFSIQDEIHFWGRQMAEHTFFLYLGLEDVKVENVKVENIKPGLKGSAFELLAKWKHFMNQNFYDKGIKINNETIFLTPEDITKVGNIDTNELNKLNELINDTSKFNGEVISVLNSGQWIGWIFPSLVEHMQIETDYFRRKVNGPEYKPEEEIKFINDHHGGEMGVAAQLIDPNPAQQKIIDIVRSYALKTMAELKAGTSLTGADAAGEKFPRQWTKADENILKGLSPGEQATLLYLSIRYSQELTDFAKDTGDKIESNQLKSIISPVLAHHVHREFARFTERLNLLSGINA